MIDLERPVFKLLTLDQNPSILTRELTNSHTKERVEFISQSLLVDIQNAQGIQHLILMMADLSAQCIQKVLEKLLLTVPRYSDRESRHCVLNCIKALLKFESAQSIITNLLGKIAKDLTKNPK